MALNIPNIAHLVKEAPELGEALQKVQTYITANVTPVAGNRTPKPPIDATRGTG